MATYPDDLGLNQTRVLDSANRSFESVTYQRKKPPLSCEVNLTGKLASDHAQDIFHATSPSGWINIGSIRDNVLENLALSGDVLCSSAYARNSFKLMAKDKGVANGQLQAWVNGMKVVVEGSTSTDENNIITLPDPSTSGSAVYFVFLEAWRKLITPSDVVYKNGNILYIGLDNPANDLIDPAIDIETSLRIQVQYRIRVAEVDIENYPSGFGPTVSLQGPLVNPLGGSYTFSPVSGDPGLWRAGVNDSATQELIGTVDGYTYAIPMFAIAQRNTTPYDPISASNGSGRTLANYLAGIASDRPDNKYSDLIDADDILDMRCRSISVENAKEVCEKAFNKLLSGNLRSKMTRSLLGQDHYGVTLTQVDTIPPQIDPYDSNAWSDTMGGLGTVGDGKRRVFANAAVDQPLTLTQKTTANKIVGLTNNPWLNGDTVELTAGLPVGTTIDSVDDAYVTGSNKTVSIYPMPYVAISGPDVLTSTDGASWTTRTTGSTENLNAVVVGGNIIVAVGNNGTICSSYDGVTWSVQTVSGTPDLYGITWNVDKFITVGQDILYSEDGLNWTTAYSSGSSYRAIVWDGGKFLAVGEGNKIITSPTGATWTPIVGPNVSASYYGVIWDGSQYVMVGTDGLGKIYTSTTGAFGTWTLQATSSNPLYSITMQGSGLTKYVAVGTGIILTSPDTLSWPSATLPTGPAITTKFNSVSWAGDQFIAVSDYDGAVPASFIIASDDGSAWTVVRTETLLTVNLTGVACGNIAISGTGTATVTGTAISTALQGYPITFDYTAKYDNGANGFTQLPETVLEFRPEGVDTSSIASINADIRVRSASALDSTLSNRGGNYTELYNFGHQMIHNTTASGSQLFLDRNLFGYNILGIASLYDGTTFKNLSDVTRTPTQYIVKGTFLSTQNLTLNLYTEGKFFQTSRQGRGIVDTFEMKEYTTDKTGTGLLSSFTIDSTNKAILKLASNIGVNGSCIAYVSSGVNEIQTYLTTNNVNLPTDSTRSRAVLEFSTPPDNLTTIKVPALTHSAIEASEGYACFYKTLPYQGLLKPSSTGALEFRSPRSGGIEAEGPAVTTTAGSGGITNIVAGTNGGTIGAVTFTAGATTLTGGDNWLSTIKPGYTINPAALPSTPNPNPREIYKIASVDSDSQVTLESPVIITRTGEYYQVRAMDLANFKQANIIDRLPTLSTLNDSSAISDTIYTAGNALAASPVIDTRIVSRVQDILNQPSENVTIGSNSADRGRSTVHIVDNDSLGLGNLGLKFEITNAPYNQKTYQSYVLNKDSSGELYLMVVGSETGNSSSTRILNERSNSDTVDIFRMPGRPLTTRRTV